MNSLKYREEFERLLANYHISAQAEKILAQLKLVILCGPSASGRNTIISQLIQRGGYSFIVSDTTRKPREDNGRLEQNGVNYWFRSEHEMLAELKAGDFLEAEIIHKQQVSGISLRELRRAYDAGLIAITDVDVGGFNNIVLVKPDTLAILILPPSFNEWVRRLYERSELPESEIRNRMETGSRIFAEAVNNKQAIVIINDQLGSAVDEVERLAHGGQPQNSRIAQKLAAQLLKQTNAYLAG
jgi:guanylate kinase